MLKLYILQDMSFSEHIQNMQLCVETLVGNQNQYLNELTQHLCNHDKVNTIEDAIYLEESTLCIFFILMTWLHFEKMYPFIHKDDHYKEYSLSHICKKTMESHKNNNLWQDIYTVYIKNELSKTIPIFSTEFLHTTIHRILMTFCIPSDLLYTIIKHIEKTFTRYSITEYKDITILYEILCQYSLYRGEEIKWTRSQLYKKYTGIYYTPQTIAYELAKYACTEILPHHPIDKWYIIDTSCGTGNLLLEIVEYISHHLLLPQDILAKYIESISSIDKIYKNALENDSIEECEKKYIKRYSIDRILYGIDINSIALGICSYCLQYTSFIPHIPCIDIKHLRCANSLFNFSYKQSLAVLNEKERKELTSLYAKYKRAIRNGEHSNAQLYRDALRHLYTHALCIHVSQKSSYHIEALYPLYREQSIHYELEFPEVFEQSLGFLLSIGNPPWEKTKFEETLFIEQYYKGYNKEKEKTKQIIRSKIHITYGKYSSFLKEKLRKEIACYKTLYPMSKGSGDDNLYRYFLEQHLTTQYKRFLCQGGYFLYLIPTGFITEESSTKLRTYILQHYSIHYIASFENRNNIFPFVDNRYKFSIICCVQNPPIQATLDFGCIHIFEKGLLEYDRFPIYYKDIEIFSKGSYAIPELRSSQDANILGSIYYQFPSLSEKYISIRRELDCASNRDLFYPEHSEFADIPLYQGAMIWQYNSQYTEAKQYVPSYMLDTLLQNRELYRLYNDVYQCLPEDYKKTYKYLGKANAVCSFIGMSRSDMLMRYIPERTLPRFVLRAIARNTDERSVICSLLPYNTAYQNSLFGSIAKRYILTDSHEILCIPTPFHRQLYSISIFNSLVYDWCMRFISAINISKAYIHRLPFPQPEDTLLEQYPYARLIENTYALQLFYDSRIQALPFFPKKDIHNEEEAITLQIENDCIVTKLYTLSKDALEHITSQTYFAVLHKKKKWYIERLLDSYAP